MTNPNFFWSHTARGSIQCSLAQYAVNTGEDPTPHLMIAISSLETALSINPRHANAYFELANALTLRAEVEHDAGRTTAVTLADARRALNNAFEYGTDTFFGTEIKKRLQTIEDDMRIRSVVP